MDTSALRAAIDDLAACVSEMTAGDLGLSVATTGLQVGELYCLHLHESLRLLDVLEHHVIGLTVHDFMNPLALSALADAHGGGFDRPYRQVACHVDAAFADADEVSVCVRYDTHVARTAEVARSLAATLDIP